MIDYHNQGKEKAQPNSAPIDDEQYKEGILTIRNLIKEHKTKIDMYLEKDINKNHKMRRDALLNHRMELENIDLEERLDVKFIINQLFLKSELLDKW